MCFLRRRRRRRSEKVLISLFNLEKEASSALASFFTGFFCKFV